MSKKKAWQDARNDYRYEEAAARRKAVAKKVGWGLFWAATFLGLLDKLIY